jgi:hypothetical protein
MGVSVMAISFGVKSCLGTWVRFLGRLAGGGNAGRGGSRLAMVSSLCCWAADTRFSQLAIIAGSIALFVAVAVLKRDTFKRGIPISEVNRVLDEPSDYTARSNCYSTHYPGLHANNCFK